MDEFYAAVGRAQLKKSPSIVARRSDVIARLKAEFIDNSQAVVSAQNLSRVSSIVTGDGD